MQDRRSHGLEPCHRSPNVYACSDVSLKRSALSADRLALDLRAPSGRITDILNGRRGVTADTALRLGRYVCYSSSSSTFGKRG